MGLEHAPPTLSVVVPTRDRASGLESVIRAVLADPAAGEVVVVDDGSVDATAEVLAELRRSDPRVRPVAGSAEGAAAARQRGLEHATGDIVLMLDDDVVAEPGLATGHRDIHHARGDPNLAVVGYMPTSVPSPRRPGDFATRFYAAEYEAHVTEWAGSSDLILESLWSGNLSLRRATWLEVGVHDPDFPAVNHNDRDLGLRMKRHGIHAVFDRQLAATHAHHRSMDQFLRDARRQGAGRWEIHRRHGDETPFRLDDLSRDLPPMVRRLVVATDRPALHRLEVWTLRGLAAIGGRVRAWALQDGAARLLRRIELRSGAVDAMRHAPGFEPGVATAHDRPGA